MHGFRSSWTCLVLTVALCATGCLDAESSTKASSAPAPQPPTGLDVLTSLDHLPLLRDGIVCKQHSSYDRTGGNDDGFSGRYTHLRRTEQGEYVIFDAQGPGCIYRFWSAQPPEGYVKLFFDDEATPRVEGNFRELFQDTIKPFAPPLTGQSSGGWYSYHPIAFAKRCIIVTEKKTGFLAIAWHKFPDGTPIETFTPELTPEQQAKYDAIQAHFADPSKAELEATLPDMKPSSIEPGPETELASFRGPATIRRIHMKLKTKPLDEHGRRQRDETLRKTVLRIYWDGDAKPAVECPLGNFFGTGFDDKMPLPDRKWGTLTFGAVPFGMTEAFYYFRLPMPFRKSARITIENGNDEPVELAWRIETVQGKVPANAAYFHAQWREHVTKQGQHVPILETTGRGHFVGTVLSMQSPWWLTYLEGDEKIYVDGETRPSIHGTGTEDYFNCGWYYAKGRVARPFHGLTVVGDPQSRTSQYRMHVPDCVPFTKTIKVEIEHGESNNKPYTNYAIVAYWYQDSTSHERPFDFPPAANLRLPGTVVTYYENHTNFEDLADTLDVEAGLQAGGGTSAFVPIRELDDDYAGPRRWLITSDGPGAYARWEITVPGDDLYTPWVVASRRPDFGIVELYVDGAPTGKTFDLYFDRFHHDFHLRPEPMTLTGGTHWLELRVVGKNEKSTGYNMALAAYRVDPASAFPTAWNVVGAFAGNKHDYGFGTAHPPEQGVDLNATYTGATGEEIAWSKLETRGLTWIHGKFPPNNFCVAYAHTYVKSPDERQTSALVSTDDAGKLFVNGELIFAIPGVNHLKVDKFAVPITLKPGWNDVLLKVCQAGGHWGWSFRIRDLKGDLIYATTKEEPPPEPAE